MSEIYTKICPKCGIEFKTVRGYQKYCSTACSNRHRGQDKGDFDPSLDWKRDHDDGKWKCPYQSSVGCFVRECSRCGWNPEVAKARTEAYERKWGAENG